MVERIPTEDEYAAEQVAMAAAKPLDGLPVGPPERLASPSWWLVGFLVLVILADGAAIASGVDYVGLLRDLDAGVDVRFETAAAADDRQANVALMQAITYLAAAIAFIVWFRRAYRNLPRLGFRDLRFRPGWAVGGWFVPFLNFVRPKSIANDIWRASDPEASPDSWHDRRVARGLMVWWALWLVSGIIANVAGRLFFKAETLDEQIAADTWWLAAYALDILSALVTILFVRALSSRQDAQIDRSGLAGHRRPVTGGVVP